MLELSAIPVGKYAIPQSEVANHGTFPSGTVDFCNVTVKFTSGNIGKQVIVEVWLPSKGTWNDRIMAVGGGGLLTGSLRYDQMAGIVGEKFATYTTDAGLGDPHNPVSWALNKSGDIDEDMMECWGHTSLSDMVCSLISK